VFLQFSLITSPFIAFSIWVRFRSALQSIAENLTNYFKWNAAVSFHYGKKAARPLMFSSLSLPKHSLSLKADNAEASIAILAILNVCEFSAEAGMRKKNMQKI
jgi:hypothetical protein